MSQTKQQSMHWKHPSSPPPKKSMVVSSASVFWDAKGIHVFIDYLQKGQTINGEYYANLLRQLRKAIKSKRPGKLTKGVLFHQDNAAAHKSVVAMAAVRDCGFELVNDPPYFPDLAPSDYFLFPNMMMRLYLLLRTFLSIRMRAFIPQEPKRCNTDGRNVWTAGEITLENEQHLVKFNHYGQAMDFSATPRS
ncbi:histone-lysine N-methyltransferase SETMAR-like protein [Lates japonicus]|uniref:Histone-lysine N-methyltransferase SETMAR-like protein n=1 Tax=Lates japonicus TaxID=270547 RepID=A0AAD3MZD2_LATJO|nr:histone-lysine N-methyltransferase SETMAR-like protein [Lates japonicus]